MQVAAALAGVVQLILLAEDGLPCLCSYWNVAVMLCSEQVLALRVSCKLSG